MGFWDWFSGGADKKRIVYIEGENKILKDKVATLSTQILNINEAREAEEIIANAAFKKVKELSDIINILKEPNYTDKPTWLEETNDIYKPSIKVVEKGSLYNINIHPKDIFAISPTLERVVEEKGFRNLINLDERLWNIWSYVTDRIAYAYDADEGWEYPTTTYYRMKGDCEDSTILFVTLCRLSGIKSDSIFNVCGWWKMTDGSLIGHSFPIARNTDGKWYVYETTIPSINASTKPKLFKGSNYTADFGMSNWSHYGRIKDGNQI